MQEILKDRTEGKTSSHRRLLVFIEKYNDEQVFARVYLKDQLLRLCEAYGVPFRQSESKLALASKLIESIKSKASMSFVGPVDDRQYQIVESHTDESTGSVRMRIRLSGSLII